MAPNDRAEELWEGTMLNPPPMLCVNGPLLALLTSVTLSSVVPVDVLPDLRPMSTQTHVIPLEESIDTDSPYSSIPTRKARRENARRRLREAAAKSGFGASLPHERRRALVRDREVLEKGLAFSGLWIGEEVGKGKGFRLHLSLGYPGLLLDPASGSPLPFGVEYTGQTQDPTPFIDGLPELDVAVDAAYIATMVHSPQHANNLIREANISLSAKGGSPPSAPAWATLLSSPLAVVSKPSQKTAKAGSTANCLTERDSFALCVRINAQTVRTKYMNLEQDRAPQLTARTGKWTPFRFEVVSRANSPETDGKVARNRFKTQVEDELADVLTFGSVVVLVDVQTRVRSEAVKLVKVEKNEVILGSDEGRPISELQRVALPELDWKSYVG
ncbi:MAG: hypothetical protein TREMPRED_005563 [Tremellales sp. Tagirdzhanova-0007]|nr:MAG: hypothetical protein TREMPRED_005563 [Tremellales sp. Tagirdzhanova-0007]